MKGLLELVVRPCGCGCNSTKLFLLANGEESGVLAEVSTPLMDEHKEVEKAFLALAEKIGRAVVESAGGKNVRTVVTKGHELN